MHVYFDDDKPDLDAISHYGVPGMKWGVRKDERRGVRTGSPVPATRNIFKFRTDRIIDRYNKSENDEPEIRAKKATKALNELDRVRAVTKFDREYYQKKAEKANKKGKKRAYTKYQLKATNNSRIEKLAERSIKNIKKDQEGKYTISEKDAKHYVVRGRNAVLGAFAKDTSYLVGTAASLSEMSINTSPLLGAAAQVSTWISNGRMWVHAGTALASVPYAPIAAGIVAGGVAGATVTLASVKRVPGTKYKVNTKG